MDEKEVKLNDEVNEVTADVSTAGTSLTDATATTTADNNSNNNVINNENPTPTTKTKTKQRGNSIDLSFQKLEEKAKKAEEAHAAEEKLRKELEVLNSKLLAEKTQLLESLAGEKGSLQEFQEKTAKLQAQKNDLDNQLRVST